MSWKLVRTSVIGSGHLAAGIELQDDCRAEVFSSCKLDNDDVLVAVVADGAGSAKLASIGSETTCQTFFAYVTEFLKDNRVCEFTRQHACDLLATILDRLNEEAAQRSCIIKDFACTLVAAIATRGFAAFIQIGDGGIVAKTNASSGIVFWPTEGSYANSTNFVTCDDAQENIQFFCGPVDVEEIALISDGLQSICWEQAKRIPHMPFFEPLLARLRMVKDSETDALEEQLRLFLSSDRVNDRTDDDKTLVLATRRT